MSDWPGPPRSSEAASWYPVATMPAPVPYRSLAGLSAWTFWLLAVMSATYAVNAVRTAVTRGLGGYSTPVGLDRLGGVDLAPVLVGLVQTGLFLAAGVLFVIWFYRAYENLRPLAAPEPRRDSGWTLGAWFVPILNLVLPKLMLNEIWRGSDPDPARDPSEVRIPASTACGGRSGSPHLGTQRHAVRMC